ncbi:MAG: glutathione S-transferase family protein [Pseudomonadales bacterium]
MPLIEHPKSAIPGQLKGLHLFHYDGAPCAQRVRLALGEKGLARGREERFDAVTERAIAAEPNCWVSRMVSLVKKDHLTETYAEIHPNMVVPALVHDGELYLESLDIIEYLDAAFGGAPLIPTEPAARAAAMNRVDQAKQLHVSIRYVTFHWGLGSLARMNQKERDQLAKLARQGDDGENLVTFYDGYSNRTIPDSVYLDHLTKLYSAFCELNEELQDGRQYLMSDNVSIADAFWSMKVLRLLECGYPMAEHHPILHDWYQRVYQRPSFQNEVMGKNRLGNRVFRAKAQVETWLGKGLKQAVESVAA